MKPKPCKYIQDGVVCGATWHTAWYHKPRSQMVTTKPMNKVGKVQKQTAAAVAKWKRTIKPNHEGYYICEYCGRWITYLEAEHSLSKARHPEFRTDITKFKITCDPCNEKKGSKDYTEMEAT